ncbi:Thiol-disulfide oxidoreductase ResA [anaerobic digester metagenome]
MKTKTILPLLLVVVATVTQAQKTEPLILQGQITNSPEKELYLFTDSLGKYKPDTLRLDNEGRFHLKTYNVINPQKVDIQNKRTQLNNIYVAPGYNLTITADATDFPTTIETTRITGKGAESNRYRELYLKEYIARKDSVDWYEITDETKFLNYLETEKQLTDSLEKVAFGKVAGDDPYFSLFAEMTHMDNLFLHEYKKIAFTKLTGMNAGQAREFVKKQADAALIKDINNEAYFVSENYKGWYVNAYLDYLLKLDYDKDSTLLANNFYSIEKTDEILKGKIREYILYNKLMGKIHYASGNFQQLNEVREKARPYVASLENRYFRQAIENAFAEKEKLLYHTQKGQPAPPFMLGNDKDKVYSLSDFKGKVIYLDLWASWCAPCRAQIPALKKIYDTYKNDDRIEIIGIAVNDGKKEWLRAIQKDMPQWLQLYDESGAVHRSYNAIAIPRYVLIDKKGNIADFDAPRPSDDEKLISKINKLLEEK